MPVEVLVWQAGGMEDDVGEGSAGKVRTQGSAKFGKRSAEQAQGSSDTVSLRSPSRSGTSAKRRRSRHAWQRRVKGQRPWQLSMGIARDSILTKRSSLRMFSEKAPKQHQLPPQQVGTWLAAALGSHHVRNRIGGMSIVGAMQAAMAVESWPSQWSAGGAASEP